MKNFIIIVSFIFLTGCYYANDGGPETLSNYPSITTMKDAYWSTTALNRVYCTNGTIAFTGDSRIHFINLSAAFDEQICNVALGMTKINYVVSQYENIRDMHSKKLFIAIGTNNLKEDRPMNDLLAEYQSMVKLYKGLQPGTRLYFQCVLPFGHPSSRYPDREEKAEEFNAGIKNICDAQGVEYIDIYTFFIGHPEYYIYDGVHLSQAGKVKYAELIQSYVDE